MLGHLQQSVDVCPRSVWMAQGNGTCVSSQDVAVAELGPLPEGKRHTKSSQSVQSGACSAPQENKSGDGNQLSATRVRWSRSPWTVCCPLPGAGSPTSRHHACAESILHQHSGLTASGPTCLLFAVPLEGSLAVPLRFVHPPQEKTAFGRVFSSASFYFSFYCCFIYSSYCHSFPVFPDYPIRDCSFDLETVVSWLYYTVRCSPLSASRASSPSCWPCDVGVSLPSTGVTSLDVLIFGLSCP